MREATGVGVCGPEQRSPRAQRERNGRMSHCGCVGQGRSQAQSPVMEGFILAKPQPSHPVNIANINLIGFVVVCGFNL